MRAIFTAIDQCKLETLIDSDDISNKSHENLKTVMGIMTIFQYVPCSQGEGRGGHTVSGGTGYLVGNY